MSALSDGVKAERTSVWSEVLLRPVTGASWTLCGAHSVSWCRKPHKAEVGDVREWKAAPNLEKSDRRPALMMAKESGQSNVTSSCLLGCFQAASTLSLSLALVASE